MRQYHPLLALLLVATAAPAAAQSQDALTLTVEAFQEIQVVKKGRTETRTVPIARAVPGSEVIYVVTYHNTGTQAAENVVVTNPIPPELDYKDGSAFGAGTRIELSVDGKRWGSLAVLTVPGPNGKALPAQAADVRQLRWTLDFAVKPGETGKVTYRTVIR